MGTRCGLSRHRQYMQALAKLFNTSVDELLDYTRAGLASAMREPIDLDAYPIDTKGYSASDLAVTDKFADADQIESLNRHRRLTWWQKNHRLFRRSWNA